MKKLICFLLMLSFSGICYADEADIVRFDVYLDGKIDTRDLEFVASAFGETIPATAVLNPDMNGDGTVNILDLVLVVSHFGETYALPAEVTDATFDSVVLDSELPVVVEFKSDFCGYCIRMRPVVAAVAAAHRETFTFVKLDVNTQRVKTAEYEIRATPTYIVFQNGEVAGSFGGAMAKEKLIAKIFALISDEGD